MSHATDVLNRILAIKKLEPRQLSDELNCSRQLITKMFETGDIDVVGNLAPWPGSGRSAARSADGNAGASR